MGNGMIREIDLHDSLKVKLDNNMYDATAIVPTITQGGNNVIKNEGKVSISPKFTIKGEKVINLLGSVGNCEDVSKLISRGATLSLDSNIKEFGINSIKVNSTINTQGCGLTTNPINIDASIYYCVSVYMYNTNFDSMQLMITDNAGVGLIASSLDTEKSKFKRHFVKFKASDISNILQIKLYARFVTSAIGQIGYIDGLMLEEITQAQYNDVSYQPSPYVEGYACLKNPYIEVKHDNLVRNGNGEEGTAWWMPSWCMISIVNGKIRLTGEEANDAVQLVHVNKNTDYYIDANVTTGTTTGQVQTYSVDSLGNLINPLPLYHNVFNTLDNELIAIRLRVGGTGYVDFDSIMLVEGTTAPTEYKSCTMERCVIEGDFADGDSLLYENGQISGIINWKHKTLFGKDYDWTYLNDYIGFKRIQILTIDNNAKGTINYKDGNVVTVKYDGKLIDDDATLNVDKSTINDNKILLLTVSDSETGWSEAFLPNNDEVKIFMNGWKAVTGGTRIQSWVNVLDGSVPSVAIKSTVATAYATNSLSLVVADGTKFVVGDVIMVKGDDGAWRNATISAISTNTLTINAISQASSIGKEVVKIDNGTTDLLLFNYCKNNVAPGYEGYKLHYKLQIPEPISDVNVKIRGDIPTFGSGDNYLFIDSGIVLGEMVEPKDNGSGTSAIGYNVNSSQANSPLKYIDGAIIAIYKNSAWDSWTYNM